MNRIVDDIEKILFESVEWLEQQLLETGQITPGHNGPYNDQDTSLRIISHWCVVLSYLYKRYGIRDQYELLKKLGECLMCDDSYGFSGAAICRINSDEDDTNGVIGQAWVVEGLLACYEAIKDDRYIKKATALWKVQPYNLERKVFGVITSDGRSLCGDYTFNHNLWFVAMGSKILNTAFDETINKAVMDFVGSIDSFFYVSNKGLILHRMRRDNELFTRIKFLTKLQLIDWGKGKYYTELSIEKGYQLFDLFGFALLKKEMPNLPVFKSYKLQRAIKLACSSGFLESLYSNKDICLKYSYAYNSPAYEYPFMAKMLNGEIDLDIFNTLLDKQNRIYKENLNSIDYNTLHARVYELVRFCELFENP